MKRLLGLAIVAGAVLSSAARAHEFTCDKTVLGATSVFVVNFPVLVPYQIQITNVHPTEPSVLLSATDDLLSTQGYVFSLPLPYSVPVGESVTETFDLTLDSYEECLEVSALDGEADELIDNVYRISWESGETQCVARVACQLDHQPPPTGATRTLGYFRNHIPATQQCVDAGPVDLGFLTIFTLEDALGLLHGSPNEFEDGTDRNQLDRFRFLLGRQTLVGICNQRLFGTAPSPADLLTDAVAALGTTDCTDISGLIGPVDAFNNSGDEEPFPGGFEGGGATPQDAAALAVDPTSPSGQSCSP